MQLTVPQRDRYLGGFIGRLATLGTRWHMHTSRKFLLKHFDARAAEYRNEMDGGQLVDNPRAEPGQVEKPVCNLFFFWIIGLTTSIMLLYRLH
jgi:hypothetical protein